MRRRFRPLNWIAIAALLGVFVLDAWPAAAAGVPVVAPARAQPSSNCYEFPGDFFTSPWTGLSYLSSFPIVQIDNNADTWKETYIQGYVIAPNNTTITSLRVDWTATSGVDVYTEAHVYGFTGAGWYAGTRAINHTDGIHHHVNGSFSYVNPSPSESTVRTVGVDIVMAPETSGYDAPTSLSLDFLQICTTSAEFATVTPTASPTITPGGPTLTPSATPTNSPTPGPSPTQGPPGSDLRCDDTNSPPNFLCNGNFELPRSTNHDWAYSDQSQVRTNNDSPTNGGLAFCGRKFANINGEGITQRVYLPAAPLFLTLRLRKKAEDGDFIHPQVEIMGTDSSDIGRQWIVIDGKNGDSAYRSATDFGWQHYAANHTFLVNTAGYYDVKIYNVIPKHNEGGSFLGTPTITTVDWSIDRDPADDFQVDDIFLSTGGYKDYCPNGAGGPTATPEIGLATRTPTPTKTRTPTPGGPTATPRPISGWSNCDFEQGQAGWSTVNRVVNQLAGGPVGPQFARLLGNDSSLSQSFSWGGGLYYFTGWIGPGSAGSVKIVSSNGTVWSLWSQSESTPAWKLVRFAIVYLPAGSYRLEVRGNQFQPMDVDGLMPGANGYKYCGGSTNGATPTAGPTSFVTATATRTPPPGPTATPWTPTATATKPTHTPNATWTASATYTQVPSSTPSPTLTPANGSTATSQAETATSLAATATSVSSTATAQASITPATATNTPPPATATHTPTPGNADTATAQASITPATGTPTGTTVASQTPRPPTATTMPNPNPQPEPAPQADCQRPDNPFNLAGWMEYEVCTVLTWTLWNDQNSEQVLNIQATLQAYEPMGTLNELSDARDQLQGEINQFDWANTGLQSGELPDLEIFFPNSTPNGLLTGNFSLTPDPGGEFAFVTTCGVETANVFGDAMSKGFCAALNWMMVTGILNWAQYFFDVVIWIGFLRYVWKLVTVEIPQIL